jgi:O-antigen/teichoic acid export membrane protein
VREIEGPELRSAAAQSRSSGLRAQLSYFLWNGPPAIFASSLPGAVNFAIILFLVYRGSAADAGQYRLIFSFFSLAGLLTLLETSKVFLRGARAGDRALMTLLFAGRIYASLLALGLAVAIALVFPGLVFAKSGPELRGFIIAAAALAVIYAVFDLYAPYLQANLRFARLFWFALAKYSVAFGLFAGLVLAGVSIPAATLAQLAAMTAFHLIYFFVTLRREIDLDRHAHRPTAMLGNTATREAATLSLANLLPSALEHVDKLVIGAVFGLEVLGIYTLGFSTGRFIYNTLKPAIYIYYRRFVERLPPLRLIVAVGIGFSIFGIVLAGAFLFLVATLPLLAKFRGTETVAVVIFLSYGLAMADAVFAQAYAINPDTQSAHLFFANTAASLACLALFVIAALLPQHLALPLFAAHYALRHGLTLLILAVLRRRALAEGQS